MADDLADLSLTTVAAMIGDRRVSSAEVTEACIARINRLGPTLRCIAAFDEDQARAAAAEADRRLDEGAPIGPLHGVPLAHKDMFYRRGRISGCGSKVRDGEIATTTSTALARLDAAGALDIAQLAMVEFALGLTGYNEVMGTPRNPWNLERVTGGSSSGPAAAVSAGCVFAALGSDTGGSIRVPASCCGLVGLKPTTGLVSRHGCLPLAPSLDHVGPLTRTVSDCALVLQAIAGHDPLDPSSRDRPVPDYSRELEAGIEGLRIAIPETYFYDLVEPEIARLLEDSLDIYRRLGAVVVPVTIPLAEHANPLTTLIIAVEGASVHARAIERTPDAFGPQTLARLLPGLEVPAVRYLDALKFRETALHAVADAVFSVADILHLPVVPSAVPTIAKPEAGTVESDAVLAVGHCSRPVNYWGLPALAMPIGHTFDGLPVGMQLVGRPFSESVLLRAARAFERATGVTEALPAA